MRTLKAVIFYRAKPEALVFRAAARTTGAAPVPDPPPAFSLLLQRIRRTPGAAADAVLMSAAAGGARYASVRQMKAGDVTPRFLVVRHTKTSRFQFPTVYAWPTAGWIRRRLRPYIQPVPPTRDWTARPRLFPHVTTRAMAAVVPARTLRRAVAAEVVAAGGAGAVADAAQTLGNSARTVRGHYCPTPTAGAERWAIQISRLSRGTS